MQRSHENIIQWLLRCGRMGDRPKASAVHAGPTRPALLASLERVLVLVLLLLPARDARRFRRPGSRLHAFA